ncbi:MAG: hypothetical protein P1U32_06135 [Legionellaceae bacterium]|nr:hypothetical protein [Legionellaceae bacterium]
MKRLIITGVMMCALAACGGNDVPPVPDANTDDMTMQPAASPDAQTPATMNAPAPATGAPTEEQMTGAAAQE